MNIPTSQRRALDSEVLEPKRQPYCYGRLSLEGPLPVYHTFTFHACGHAGVCIHA